MDEWQTDGFERDYSKLNELFALFYILTLYICN